MFLFCATNALCLESLNIFESSAFNVYLQRRLSIYLMNAQAHNLHYHTSIEWRTSERSGGEKKNKQPTIHTVYNERKKKERCTD